MEAFASRAAWPAVPVVPGGCWTATVGIWPRDVLMTTGTCMATRTVLQAFRGRNKQAVRGRSERARRPPPDAHLGPAAAERTAACDWGLRLLSGVADTVTILGTATAELTAGA